MHIIIIFKINYAKIEFLSISGVIFSPATDPHQGSVPGPDLPLLFKQYNIMEHPATSKRAQKYNNNIWTMFMVL